MITPKEPQSVERVARHYDELDRYYRDLWGEHVHHGWWRTGRESAAEAVEHLVDRVAEVAGIEPGDRVCDVGCGYGATSRKLARNFGARVVGLTVSARQAAFARSFVEDGPNPTYLLRSWESNGLDDASFDRVISIECLSHVADKGLFFREIGRVLRPGGRAVVTAWLCGERPQGWRTRWLLEPICREGCLPGLGSADDCRSWIGAADLVLLDSYDLTRQVRKTWRICLHRLLRRLAVEREYRDLLRGRGTPHRVFAVTLCRLLVAYHVRAMGYGLFVMTKSQGRHPVIGGREKSPGAAGCVTPS